MANSDYQRIATAIRYLATNAEQQPSLEMVATTVNLSPYHFQRMFTRWAGTSPKRFLQALTVERGKALLAASRNLLAASDELGLSGVSRLHDHFVQLQGMSPGEHRNGGAGVTIGWGEQDSPFGQLFIAATGRGICRAGFTEYSSTEEQLAMLRDCWPKAEIEPAPRQVAGLARTMFAAVDAEQRPLSLKVSGTNFQLAVWRALLEIPEGCVQSYGDIARKLGQPGSSRAVGNAVGANPVAFLIPCHRVIRESGALGGYRWGETRKQAMQVWEQARCQGATEQADLLPVRAGYQV